MIGQTELFNKLTTTLPNCTLLLGRKGIGKKTLAIEVCKSLNIPHSLLSNKVEALKNDIITDINIKYVYIIPNFDTASINAKNSLLKILEDCPLNIYFILTAEHKDEIPGTILSRCQQFNLVPYSKDELKTACDNKEIVNICDTFLEIQQLEPIYDDFNAFCDKVINHIGTISLSNALKIGTNLQLKKDAKGYDLELFFKLIMYKFYNKYEESNDINYIQAYNITSKSLNMLNIVSVNRQMLFDNWVFKIRNIWNYKN